MESLYGRRYSEAQHRRTPNAVMTKVAELPILPGERVLEIGVGNRDIISHIKSCGGIAYGIDINPAAIQRVKEAVPDANLVVADALKLPFPDETFDKVVSVHTLEHIPDLSQVFAELYRVTMPGGEQLHIFPSDWFFRAESSIGDALKIHPFNPYKALMLANQLHQHKLDLDKISRNHGSQAPFTLSLSDFPVRTYPFRRHNYSLKLYK